MDDTAHHRPGGPGSPRSSPIDRRTVHFTADFKRVPWVEDKVMLARDLHFREGAFDDASPRVGE